GRGGKPFPPGGRRQGGGAETSHRFPEPASHGFVEGVLTDGNVILPNPDFPCKKKRRNPFCFFPFHEKPLDPHKTCGCTISLEPASLAERNDRPGSSRSPPSPACGRSGPGRSAAAGHAPAGANPRRRPPFEKRPAGPISAGRRRPANRRRG